MSPIELVRERLLGSEAVYRVIKRLGDLVEVEVVRSPKLDPGRHTVFTAEAVAHMKGIEMQGPVRPI
jgi:hypothetical protein